MPSAARDWPIHGQRRAALLPPPVTPLPRGIAYPLILVTSLLGWILLLGVAIRFVGLLIGALR